MNAFGAALSTEPVTRVLERPDIAPLAVGHVVECAVDLTVSFLCIGSSRLKLGAAALLPGADLDFILRHGLELALQLEIVPDDSVLAGLMAARVAALFAALEPNRQSLFTRVSWLSAFADEAVPTREMLEQLWPLLARHQKGALPAPSAETLARLAAAWPFLGPAEHLMGGGGDNRLKLDPVSGLNVYGSSHRPRPWAVTFASSTASSVSERGYVGAENARRRLLRNVIAEGAEQSQKAEVARIRRALLRHYGLSDTVAVVLTPSGTDGELAALAVALLADPDRPMTNLLIAPEETGSGVPLAATGRHFAVVTARGIAAEKGSIIAGFPADIELAPVPVRGIDGAVRDDAEIFADCREKVETAVARGRRVLFHVLDLSKTGLLAPAIMPDRIVELWGDAVDVVVDACQARLSAAAVRAYVERGFMVLLTGSKFFTGPPFAGALLLPPAIAARLDAGRALPSGLPDYFCRFDWPEGASSCAALPGESNIGVVHRWAAALEEMEAFATIGADQAKAILQRFGSRVRAGIEANPDLVLHETPAPKRPQRPLDWDNLPTISTFSMLAPGKSVSPRRRLDPSEARLVYEFLNSDLSTALPAGISRTERHLASLRCHIGQPVPLVQAGGAVVGALRISAGARLVSGEPSRAELEPDARLEGEIADALAVLDKISLILRHFERIRQAAPRPTYR